MLVLNRFLSSEKALPISIRFWLQMHAAMWLPPEARLSDMRMSLLYRRSSGMPQIPVSGCYSRGPLSAIALTAIPPLTYCLIDC